MLMEALASSEVVSLRGKSSIPDWPEVCGRGRQLCLLRLVCGLPLRLWATASCFLMNSMKILVIGNLYGTHCLVLDMMQGYFCSWLFQIFKHSTQRGAHLLVYCIWLEHEELVRVRDWGCLGPLSWEYRKERLKPIPVCYQFMLSSRWFLSWQRENCDG